MRKNFRALALYLSLTCLACALGAWMYYGDMPFARSAAHHRIPAGGHEDEEEEEGDAGKQAQIKAYFELMHRAAPGTNWRKIELDNARANERLKLSLKGSKATGSFAGGLVNGVWHERGNNNTAGRMSSFAYDAPSNTLYSLSDAGTLWTCRPPGGGWTLLNDGYKLASKVLAITPIGAGSNRILMALDSQIVYSDNNGATLQVAKGISYGVNWAGNIISKIVVVNDAVHSVYAVVSGWNASPWGQACWLYRSADSGRNFSPVQMFFGKSATQIALFNPINSATLFALTVGPASTDSLFLVNASGMLPLNAINIFPASKNAVALTGSVVGGMVQLYALVNNTQLYQSGNGGMSWNSVSTLPGASWGLLASSTVQPNRVFFGNIEAYGSANGGRSFTKVSNWGDYYGYEAIRLHADIQAINFFQNSSGQEFCMIGTDGGAYYSTDYLANVSNISLSGLKVNQLWHHITDPNNPNVLFSGMQDQGLCHTAVAGGTGLITQKQLISGDYGQLCISGFGGMLWAEYPGGDMYIYGPTLSSPNYLASWTMGGSQKSNQGWMLPTASIPGSNDDILIGGGNITGGGGSYLAKLSFASGVVNAVQFPINFRAASNSNSAGLSSLAVSPLDARIWFAATEDGTFFHSGDAGSSWVKANGFSGTSGNWLYGAAIAPSRTSKGTVYFGGSGYSNPGVFVSTDTGRSFTAMSNGLPKTLVNSLAVAPNDSLIFAATDAGPYVFITAQQQWYPLIESNTPGCVWRTVEFLPSIRTARFSTYGRGVWDFVLDLSTPSNAIGSAPSPLAQVALYPNPARPGASLHIQGLSARPADVSFFDGSGRRAAVLRWAGSGALDMPALLPGIYVYRISQESSEFSGRLSIQ